MHMKPFLKELAEDLYLKYKEKFSDLTVVFPNRRAGIFFRQYLSELIDKPVWAPEIVSVEDFVVGHSDFQVADKLTLVFELYEEYKKMTPLEEGFDRFYFWGEMLLKDFDDIDHYMVNAKDVFINLKNQKELDNAFDYLTEEQKEVIRAFWQSFRPPTSAHQDGFLQLWRILFDLYEKFKAKLASQGIAYTGMVYRDFVEKTQKGELNVTDKQVVFAGFNALSRTEERIFSWFRKHRSAEMYWDTDALYMENEQQEAGMFMRRYLDHPDFGATFQRTWSRAFEQQNVKQIEIVGVPMEVGQAKKLGEHIMMLMGEDNQGFDPSQTVIVLPDEQNLFPVLHSLPDAIQKINVTMGFPLRNTPLYGLMEHLLDLQQGARVNHEGKKTFHYKNVLAVLRHPYIMYHDAHVALENIQTIEKENRIYILPEALTGQDGILYQAIFKDLVRVNDVFDYLLDILAIINEGIIETDYEYPVLEQEFIYHFYTHLTRLKEIIARQNIELSMPVFLRLFRQLIQSLRLPFSGEPLNGLQVMGVLETRNLDFENVFILSMNEGLFPATGSNHSFIPFNLRKGFGLPVYLQQDAIYAYHFYRILQRARRVFLYYNTEEGQTGGGEMSRFLYQLIYESGLPVRHRVLSNPVALSEIASLTIEKNTSIRKILEKYFVVSGKSQSRLTPSALNTYLDCRMRFYFKYVAGLYESDVVQEEVDPMVFGNLLHRTMELVYKRFIGAKQTSLIHQQDFPVIQKGLDEAIEQAFVEHYGRPSSKKFEFEGRNIIVREIIKKFSSKILESDKAYAPFEIKGLELDGKDGFRLELPVNYNGQTQHVGLKGIIDRIDLKNEQIRVIDYKTGKDRKEIESIASLFDRDNKNRNKAAMQTMFYGLLYREKFPDQPYRIMPGLYNSKELFADNFDIRLKLKIPDKKGAYEVIEDFSPYRDEFIAGLKGLLEEIFDPAVPFDQTGEVRKCGYCPYIGICNR
jgi:hypothetical protein